MRGIRLVASMFVGACVILALPSPLAGAVGRAAPTLLWGGNVGPQLTGEQPPWDMTAVSEVQRMLGKHISVLHFGSPFVDCSTSRCTYYPFPGKQMSTIRRFGAIPFLSWSSQALQAPAHNSEFTLASIISGTYDAYIRAFARGAKSWGHPFFLRFDWEMNGDWFPWSEGVGSNKRGQYVAAWRHVHRIFSSIGAHNASWVWCPNVDPTHAWTSLRRLYPGDRYVDWTCLDGYNWGTARAGSRGWTSFVQLFRRSYTEIVTRIAPGKPMIVGEVASTEHGGSKAGWIAAMLSDIPVRFPQIRGVLWFERYDNQMDWPLETSASSVGAFARGISNRAYASNSFAGLRSSPILPPGRFKVPTRSAGHGSKHRR